MKIMVIGTGYVGLITGVCLAELGNKVFCIDIDQAKIDQLNKGKVTIYEQGLEKLLKKHLSAKSILFSNEYKKYLNQSELIFIAVGTPLGQEGQLNLKHLEKVASDIGKNIKNYKIIIIKSTVPVGTTILLRKKISRYTKNFSIIFNPEFLREGAAISDFLEPDRIVIGGDDKYAINKIIKLYKKINCPIIVTDIASAELVKLASNAYLSTSISFINILSRVADKVGANITHIADILKLDKRIGKRAFLNAGLGYGGSCLPKDIRALIHLLNKNNVPSEFFNAVERVNLNQKKLIIKKIKSLVPKLKGKKVTIWGLAFKPHTDDIREAASLFIVDKLLKQGAIISAYDPEAEINFKRIFPNISYCDNPYDAAFNSNLIIILTGWPILKNINLTKLKKLLVSPKIVDGRNIYEPSKMKKMGFKYVSIGRN